MEISGEILDFKYDSTCTIEVKGQERHNECNVGSMLTWRFTAIYAFIPTYGPVPSSTSIVYAISESRSFLAS